MKNLRLTFGIAAIGLAAFVAGCGSKQHKPLSDKGVSMGFNYRGVVTPQDDCKIGYSVSLMTTNGRWVLSQLNSGSLSEGVPLPNTIEMGFDNPHDPSKIRTYEVRSDGMISDSDGPTRFFIPNKEIRGYIDATTNAVGQIMQCKCDNL